MSSIAQRRTAGAAAVIMLLTALQLVMFTVGSSPAVANHASCQGSDAYSEFTFNFVNGTSISGDNCPGSVYEFVDSNGKRKTQEAYLPGTGGSASFPNGPGMQIHVSCSEVFTAGWASNGGDPDQTSDPNWRIADYSIVKYSANGGQTNSCREVFVTTTTTTGATTTTTGATTTTTGATTTTTGATTTTTGATTTTTGATTTTVPIPGLSALGDFVWVDSDGDCVQDGGEDPLAGVRVDLLDNGVLVASTVTGADGAYLFGNLQPSTTYQVRFTLPESDVVEYGFTSEECSAAIPDDLDSDATAPEGSNVGLTAVIDLPAGVSDLTWDAGVTAIAVRGIQIEPTTTTIAPITVGTLPFTGFGSEGVVLLSILGMTAGALLILSLRSPGSSASAADETLPGWTND